MQRQQYRRIKKQLLKAITKGIQANGKHIFRRSQMTHEGYVPVDTGYLKSQGRFVAKKDGWKMGYFTHYAAEVEVGIQGQVRKWVPPYVRKGYIRSDGKAFPPTNVKGHHQLVGPRKGRYYLRRAVSKEITKLPRDLFIQLQMAFMSRGGKLSG